MKKLWLIAAVALGLAWPTAAFSSCNGQFKPGQVCGISGAAEGVPGANLLSPLLDRNFGAPAPVGSVLNRGSSTWGSTIAPVIGNPGTSTGSIGLGSAGGGTVTITAPSIIGAVNFKLPPTNGVTGAVLTTDGAGNTSWVSGGSGTVTSVGLALPSSIFSVSGSPVTTTGTLTGTLLTQTANQAFMSPNGSSGVPAFRAIVGADLPTPTLTSLGGAKAINAVPHQWVNAFNTSGTFTLLQPAFTDISGSITPAQCLTPTTSTIGCVQAVNQIASNWINSINTLGVPQLSQPAFTDIGGSLVNSQLPVIGNLSVMANISGGSTFPTPTTTTALLDATIGNVQGDILYRNASTWVVLAPGTNGQVLTTAGASANPSWTSVTGTGTVTSIATGTGLTGGPITTSGTISFANIATGNVLANVSGISAAPSATTPTLILDVIGSTEGDILYRGSTAWQVLAPGTAGQILQTQGSGATPAWANAGSVSSVGIANGTNITATGTCTITTTGTCTIALATTLTGSLTLSGTDNFTGTFQVAGNTMTFPGSAATLLASNIVDQTVTGGANINPATNGNLGTASGTVTIDCGKVAVQYITNNAAFTLAAPANDGQCTLYLLNGASAGTITYSGWTANANATAQYVTTNAAKFFISIARINGVASLFVNALQ